MAQKQRYSGMMHLNGHLLCAIAINTTGPDIEDHEIYEIAMIPLDNNLKPHRQVTAFRALAQIENPGNVKPHYINADQLMRCKIHGQPISVIGDILELWFNKLQLGYEKKISPLAHNWPKISRWLCRWLGQKTFDYIFEERYRDIQVVANYTNDVNELNLDEYDYSKVKLNSLAELFHVENLSKGTAFGNAWVTAEIYHHMLRKRPVKRL